MRKFLLAALTAVLAAAPATAHAALVVGDAPSVGYMQARTDGGQGTRAGYVGGCTLDAVSTNGTTWTGVASIAVVATWDQLPDPLLTVDSATCDIVVDNVPWTVPMTLIRERGVAVGAGTTPFVASDTSDVKLCANVTIAGVAVPRTCEAVTRVQVPPQEVLDAVDAIVDLVNNAVIRPLLDPIVCQVFATLGQVPVLHPSILYIDPIEGDIDVLGAPFWDCPPYEW